MKWLIKNGTIASEEKTFLADLLLEDDKRSFSLKLVYEGDKLKEKNSIVLKFIDEIYHIENDYIFSLDLIKFDIIPDFIINSINEFMSSEVE